MNKKVLKLFALVLVAGIIQRIFNYLVAFILIRGTTEWTLQMETIMFYVQLILSSAAFVFIGMILRKEYDRKLFLKSATVLVVYSIFVLALEQFAQYLNIYSLISLIIYFLFIPIEIFTTITSVLTRMSTAETINWVYAIPSLFAPYLFGLFGKKPASND